jgi:polygalacturonase
MKKLIFIISLAVLFVQCKDRTTHDKANLTYKTSEVQTLLDKSKNSQVGVFNVLDYGATSGGTVEDQTAIQTAINAAAVLTGGWPGMNYRFGGTVKIPAGIWYITSPDTLKSNISIEIDKGAIFNFPVGYTGAMWVNDTTDKLMNCFIDGGRWYQDAALYTFARLTSTQLTHYIMNVTFRNMWIENADTVFSLRTVEGGAGWINANTFCDIWSQAPGEFLKTRESSTSMGIDGNVFTNITVQAYSNTRIAIDSLVGGHNRFDNLMLYDFAAYSVPHDLILNTATYTIINGANIRSANIHDYGTRNRIVTSGGLLTTGTRAIDYNDVYVYRKAAGVLKIEDAIELFPTASPPAGATEGAIYSDTDHHLYYYNGTSWVQLDN